MPAFFVAIPPLPLNCGEMRSAGGTLWVGGGSQERRGSEEDGIGGVLLPLFPQGVHFVQSLHRWILWTLWRFYRGGGCFQVAVPGVGQVGTCIDVDGLATSRSGGTLVVRVDDERTEEVRSYEVRSVEVRVDE